MSIGVHTYRTVAPVNVDSAFVHFALPRVQGSPNQDVVEAVSVPVEIHNGQGRSKVFAHLRRFRGCCAVRERFELALSLRVPT